MAEASYLSEGEIFLIMDKGLESKISLKYLKDQGVNPHLQKCDGKKKILDTLRLTSPWFSNSFKESFIPSLIMRHPSYIGSISFVSFSGVKNFLRHDITTRQMQEGNYQSYWRDIETSYSFNQKKEVTCFGIKREKSFEGSIKKAPFNFKSFLDAHNFKDWHDVSGWIIGDFNQIRNNQKNNLIIDKKTGTILFPDEIGMLEQNKQVITVDSRSIYHVHYEAYFKEGANLYGIHASMID